MTTVLVVDDDRTTARLLETLLELEGFEAIRVSDSRRVIATVQEIKPGAVLLDFYLRGTSGTALVREIRSTPAIADTPVIILSGLEVGPESLAAGADRFLLKPFDPSKLIEMIVELADRRLDQSRRTGQAAAQRP